MARPFVVLKLAISLDGFLDDCSDVRRILSSAEDRQAVDELRASCDAILVGAETIRRDAPRLQLRDEQLIARRRSRGEPPHPLKVTLSRTGDLPRENPFFTAGDGPKRVYVPRSRQAALENTLGTNAEVIGLAGDAMVLKDVLADLASAGVRKVLIEGGAKLAAQALEEGVVDTLRIAIAPVLLGQAGRARFHALTSSRLEKSSQRLFGDTVVLSGAVVSSRIRHSAGSPV